MIFEKQYIHCYAPTQRLLAIKIPFPNVKTLSFFKRNEEYNHTKKVAQMEKILFYHILQMADWYKNYFWKPHD
jgi:hypothetical protein